jgi:hypothetical protein
MKLIHIERRCVIMGPLRGSTFIFLELPKDIPTVELKERFEYWMEMVGAMMPELHANLQEHMEIDYEERTITHDGDFDAISDRSKADIISVLGTLKNTLTTFAVDNGDGTGSLKGKLVGMGF